MSFTLLGILNSQAAAAGGAGAYDLLETTILDSSASSVSFTGLDAYTDYKHLQIRFVARSAATTYTSNTDLRVKLNDGTNFSWHFLMGDGSSVTSSGAADFPLGIYATDSIPGETDTNVFGAGVIEILDFIDSNKLATTRILSGVAGNASNIALSSGTLLAGGPVTSVVMNASGSLFTGSRFSLYGIKG